MPKEMTSRNIILIGFMGSGKTCVGKLLGEQLSYRFLDTDALIEQTEKETIPRIFSLMGEEYFRSLETKLLRSLQRSLDQAILSTGGGLPLRKENAEILRRLGFVVFLKASVVTILTRLSGDLTRPLLQGEDKRDKVERLLYERTSIYEKTAHRIIVTDQKSPDEIAGMIMDAYRYAQNADNL